MGTVAGVVLGVDLVLILVGIVHIVELHQVRILFHREVAEVLGVLRTIAPREFSPQPVSAQAPLVEVYPLPTESALHAEISRA